MSPARARTSTEAVVAAARALLETGGLDAVTMKAVAERVGVRAPSLYKRFEGRLALIRALAEDITEELRAALAPAIAEEDPAQAVRLVAARFREFAQTSPAAYRLLFTNDVAAVGPPGPLTADSAAGLLGLTERLVGREQALEAARLITAFAHGFVSMEIAGAFRLGGNVDDAFNYSVEAIIAGLAPQRRSALKHARARGRTIAVR
jgi:AcrR family transcriptional regulator